MKKEKLQLSDVALYVNPSLIDHSCRDYGVWHLRFVDTSKGIDHLEWFDRFSYTGNRFRHLRFRLQWDKADRKQGVYGYDLKLEVDEEFSRSEDIKPLMDAIKTIEKARENMAIYPSKFSDYVALMCIALGVKKFVYPQGERDGNHFGVLARNYHHSAKIDHWLVSMLERNVDKTFFPESEEQQTA